MLVKCLSFECTNMVEDTVAHGSCARCINEEAAMMHGLQICSKHQQALGEGDFCAQCEAAPKVHCPAYDIDHNTGDSPCHECGFGVAVFDENPFTLPVQQDYVCAASLTDKLRVYITEASEKGNKNMALVMTNRDEHKISVLLSRDEAIRLQNQLNNFIINN